MKNIELIYDADCPNADETRNQLRRALTAVGLSLQWLEWDRADPKSPTYAREFGSPTILVDGQDIAGEAATGADSCRIYLDKDGQFSGVPSIEMITTAMKKAVNQTPSTIAVGQKDRWWKVLSALPATGTALLPNLVCPGCWPAYAGLLNSLGIGFIDYSPYLVPLTSMFLVLAVAFLGYRAKQRRGYKPFLLGLLAAVVVLISKFIIVSNEAMYAGIALLIAASVWNTWPRPSTKTCACIECEDTKIVEPLTRRS